MARPTKCGLDYFSFDVDFFSDHKIQFIRAKYGPRGVLAVIQLYCKIYREGFFIEWNEDAVLLFSKYESGIPKNEITQIINECLNRNLFNKSLFDQYGILTSQGIQKRYFEASRKRKFIKGVFAYLLIKLNDYGLSEGVFSELTTIKAEKMREIGKEGNMERETYENIDISEQIKKSYQSFQKDMVHYPTVSKMKRQINLNEFNLLVTDFKMTFEQITNIRNRMENYSPLLKNNSSVYLTIKAWHEKDIDNDGKSNKSNNNFYEPKMVLIGKA